MLPKKLQKRLEDRIQNNAFRHLGTDNKLIDFSSNDYLGFARDSNIFNNTQDLLEKKHNISNGSTGSRLLSGNHQLYHEFEVKLCQSHLCEAALVFNSGYTANLGFFSSVPQRGDVIYYDELAHASIRDGLTISRAKSYKFKHNDLQDLAEKLNKQKIASNNVIYVITESVFSMDGDSPDLVALSQLCKTHQAYLIVDEAHALGVFDFGLMQKLKIEQDCFARIITFGKAIGAHGAAILGSQKLVDYLVNFSRPFIYTTAMPPHTLATLIVAYDQLKNNHYLEKLQQNIAYFKSQIGQLSFIPSDSAIQCCLIPENNIVKSVSNHLKNKGFDVKPILSPTVSEGQERLRFCLHAYNTKKDIRGVLTALKEFQNL